VGPLRTPEPPTRGDSLPGWCGLAETGSRLDGFVLAGACTSCAVGNHARYLLLEEGQSSTRRSRSLRSTRRSSATVSRATSAPQIRWRWRHRACFSGRIWIRSETAPGLDNLVNTLPFEAGHPGVTSPLLRRVARRHVDHDAFSTLPIRERPVSRLTAISSSPRSHRSKLRLEPFPRKGTAGLRRGRVMPLSPKRQARLGRVARKRARCVRAVARQVGPEFPLEAGRGEENFSGLRFSR
jgi:hypothetical protein